MFDIAGEEPLLHDIVDEALAQCVWNTRAHRRLRGQELIEARPSIRLAVTTALSLKERERAAGVFNPAVAKVLAKHNYVRPFLPRADPCFLLLIIV